MRSFTLNAGLVGGTLLAMAVPTYAAIDYSTNIALIAAGGTGILGHASADNGTQGTLYANPGVGGGSQNNLIDNNNGSRADTWASDKDWVLSGFYDFGGVKWGTTKDNVAAVRVFMTTHVDGGWFDRPGLAGSTDNDTRQNSFGPSDIVVNNISIDPRIQYTTNGGTSWVTVTGSSSDYNSIITSGAGTASQTLVGPITFTFDAVSGINGIRVFGDGADVNNAAGSNQAGFISIAEFQVFVDPVVPEPATLGLLSVGALAALRRHRRSH